MKRTLKREYNIFCNLCIEIESTVDVRFKKYTYEEFKKLEVKLIHPMHIEAASIFSPFFVCWMEYLEENDLFDKE